MKIKDAFVTGATGFIGSRLVKQLIDDGTEVTCLVRSESKTDQLKQMGCKFVYGDLRDEALALKGVENCDTLFHVAAMKNAARPKDMLATNRSTTKNLFEAILRSPATPRVVHISSLAACGPSAKDRPTIETDCPQPVSFYGRSKLESERVATSYANQMPVSIVRPPIVLGQGDSNVLRMFKLIQKFNCHLIPGLTTKQYSVIHVDDLVNALVCVASQGQPIAATNANDPSQGIYFVAGEQLSYAELGRQIGLALGKPKTRCVHIARPIFWSVGAVNSLFAMVTNQPRFLNLDKYREAAVGDWACSADKLFSETDFSLPVPFATRLSQTVQWYQAHGWLESHNQDPLPA